MQYLKDCQIRGCASHVADVINRFGTVYLGCSDPAKEPFFMLKRFKNCYQRGGYALYLLFPSHPIQNIWPGSRPKGEGTKLGCGLKNIGGVLTPLSPALSIWQPDGAILYICTSPDGELLTEADSFGI